MICFLPSFLLESSPISSSLFRSSRAVSRLTEKVFLISLTVKARPGLLSSLAMTIRHNRRIHNHKVFKGFAQRGYCSIGWFYGFKLHLITADTGEIIDFMLTPGNVDDRKPLRIERFIKKLFGKLFGDKGYISKELFKNLFFGGVHLVTKLKRNMKSSSLTPIMDAIMLRKRAICETIIDQLKNIFQIEHSRHRSPTNFLTNLFSALIAYNFCEKKPSLIPYVNSR